MIPLAGGLVTDDHESVDAGELSARADRAASTLGAMHGRRVAILAPSGVGFLVALFGAWRAGAAVVVLSPLHPSPETTYFCDHAGVDTLIVDAALASQAAHLREGRRVLDVAAIAAGPRTSLAPRPSEDALVLYTSGTTARPKGARITHDNLVTQCRLLREAWRWSPRDRLIHSLPLHHLHGLGIALLTALSAGAGVELHAKFDADRVWNAIAACTDVPVLMAVPTMLMRLLAAFDRASPEQQARWARGARRLRMTTSGSAALAPAIAARWATISGAIPIERFGMTEIGVGTSARIEGEREPGVAGYALPTVELRVVDDRGQTLPHGHEGELHVRGPSVFPGYDRDDEATRAAFTSDGWFKTGDSVVFDEDGAMRVRGRISVDVLKSGGYKISALEIEAALRAHPQVDDVAVVGLPDDEWGDRVVAAVVARDLDEATLRAFLRAKLAPYKVPKEFRFVRELPRNSVGKVVKPTLIASLRSTQP